MDLTDLHETARHDAIYQNVKTKIRSHSVPDIQAYILKEIRKADRSHEKRSMLVKREAALSTSINGSMGLLDNFSDEVDYVQKMKVRYKFRKVLSYWAIICFIIGSLLFMIGCGFSLGGVVDVIGMDVADPKQDAFITYPILMGSVFLRVGSYCSWFRIINKSYKGEGVIFCGYVNSVAYLKSTLYAVGGIIYLAEMINKMAQHGIDNRTEYQIEVILFLTIAAILQQIAACIDCWENWEKLTSCNPKSRYFWATVLNFAGCSFFTFAGMSQFIVDDPEIMDWAYFWGSSIFGIGTWVWLYIWKQEQWRFYHPLDEFTRVNLYQQAYITLIIINISLAICVFVFYAARHEGFDHFYCLFAFYALAMNMGNLQLTNALAEIPEERGWSQMLYLMRFLTIVLFVCLILAFINIYDENLWSQGPGCDDWPSG